MATNYVDFSEAYKQINKKKRSIESVAAKAINKATENAQKKLIKNTPVGDSFYPGSPHAKDHIVITKATKGKLSTEVGFDKTVSWRVHFLEYGTIKQKPQAFIQKTMSEVEKEVATIIENHFKEALR